MTFDEWYATQKHQLSNEPVCRVIWEAATQAERETMEQVLAALGDIAGTSSSTRIRRVALGAMAMIRERMRDAASSS